jgi:hypothetical protein
MSTNDAGQGDRPIAKSGRFEKGKSGNPRGRPRKHNASGSPTPGWFPTREAIRAEAAREFNLTGATGGQQLTAREAVFRSAVHQALKGKPMLTRMVFQYFLQEDERFHLEQKDRLKFWIAYKEQCGKEIRAAVVAGLEPPAFTPHPVDVVIDWESCTIRFLGPLDDEGQASVKVLAAVQEVAYEMSIYLAENNQLPTNANEDGQLGAYMAIYYLALLILPPRLRRVPGYADASISLRAQGDRQKWGDHLKRRCQEVGLPFVRWTRKLEAQALPFMKLGLKLTDSYTRQYVLRAPRRRATL